MIHDGMANNGHYYSYIYDRVLKCWWLLNDHQSSLVDEEIVFKEALGDPKGYKSACNLFYISKAIADQIDNLNVPLFSEKRALPLQISKELGDEIKLENYQFELVVQNFQIKNTV